MDHSKGVMYNSKREGTYRILGRGKHQWAWDVLPKYLKQISPDLLFVLCDMFMIPNVVNLDLSPAKFLMYFPSDGDPFPVRGNEDSIKVLKKSDYPVAMSKFAKGQYDKYIGDGRCKYIPHGVECDSFRPFKEGDKLALRKSWSKRFGIDLTDKFIVGAVGRFQGRKAHPELIKSFADFAKDKKDVVLLMNCDPTDPAGSMVDIGNLIQRYKLHGKIFFTGTELHKGFADSDMPSIYNLFDVHALATTGEGFGIPTIEAMACGIPSILTDYTTTKELVIDNNCGWGIPLVTTITGTYNVERGFVNKKKFTDKLNELYADRSELKEKADNCRPYALKTFNFDSVVFPKWNKLIHEVLE